MIEALTTSEAQLEDIHRYSEFRELVVLAGPLDFGDSIHLRLWALDRSFLSIEDDTSNVILHLEYFSESHKLLVSRRESGLWQVFSERHGIAVHHGVLDILIIITRPIDIYCNGEPLFSINTDISLAHRIAGKGIITDFDLRKINEYKLQPHHIQTALTPKGLDNARDNKLIFDIGVFNGDDTNYYLKKGFRVMAVDAHPLFAKYAAIRFIDYIEDGQLILLNAGVGGARQSMPFYVALVNTDQSSFDQALATRFGPVSKIEVQVYPASWLFSCFGVPYYVKMDIEGHDRYMLDALIKLSPKPVYLSFETNFDGWVDYVELLADSGYSRFKLINQAEVSAIVLPFPEREGKYAAHKFKRGSSGPFGEETPGLWMTKAQVKADAERIEEEFTTGRLDRKVAWFDIHASL